ncbi:hypothetical protein QFC21_004227 [Naganishia friedmannii]|uniref:Uncharacterized protein n=1 Tax=Naganishia friedmannii TaxID=89922 RepID=A0ACC2VHL7_9TREE|nr:hypothetical protein QFC21_004227 [Naganishia friedmannii]
MFGGEMDKGAEYNEEGMLWKGGRKNQVSKWEAQNPAVGLRETSATPGFRVSGFGDRIEECHGECPPFASGTIGCTQAMSVISLPAPLIAPIDVGAHRDVSCPPMTEPRIPVRASPSATIR